MHEIKRFLRERHAWRFLLWFCALFLVGSAAHAQLFLNVNKSFSPINPNVGQTASMVVTFANTNPTVSATSIAGTDTLPSGLAFTNAGIGTCGFATSVSATYTGGATLNWASGIIPPNSTCTVTAIVTPFAAGTWVNTIPPENVSGFIGSSTVSAFSTASATITAGGSFAPITGAKTFSNGANVIHGGGTQSYTIVLTNPNALPLSGVGYTDTFPTPSWWPCPAASVPTPAAARWWTPRLVRSPTATWASGSMAERYRPTAAARSRW